jgi:hypothetical protein
MGHSLKIGQMLCQNEKPSHSTFLVVMDQQIKSFNRFCARECQRLVETDLALFLRMG